MQLSRVSHLNAESLPDISEIVSAPSEAISARLHGNAFYLFAN
jgi:hypothetical protein